MTLIFPDPFSHSPFDRALSVSPSTSTLKSESRPLTVGLTDHSGGLGRANSNETMETDTGRQALFGDAKERAEQRQQASAPSYEYNAGQDGAYGDRQLTAEEEEEEDITATKQEIKFMKQQDVASTRNALQMAAAAEESGRSTLARLGDQGERIHNTEKNLDLAANHNLSAEDKYKELKRLNRSMFAPNVSNPFTGKERRARRDEEIYERHRKEREQRVRFSLSFYLPFSLLLMANC
jgi:hypothetical protein